MKEIKRKNVEKRYIFSVKENVDKIANTINMWRKKGKIWPKKGLRKKVKLYTEHKQVILASSSETRVNYLKQHLDRILVVRHKVDEKKIKDEFIETNFTDLVRLLAKKKAESVMEDYSKNIIIGSDQILVCEGKLINKSENLSDAKNNLINLRGKDTHL